MPADYTSADVGSIHGPEHGTTGSRPSSPGTGEMYFDTTLGKPVWWDGTEWVDATGASA